jgi:hypothetical protein
MSVIERTFKPAFCIERTADSRPGPGPMTRTSTSRMPCSIAWRAAFCAAMPAAKGVLLRDPRKPLAPALPCAKTFPCGSAIVINVLLNEALTVAMPTGMFFFSLRRPLRGRRGACFSSAILFARDKGHGTSDRQVHLPPATCRPTPYYFFALDFLRPATVFFAPRLVRAFVRVRCPRTGKLRRWRRPR